MRTRSPSRTARFGLACSPLTSTLPPSHARLASDRVLNRHAMSSHTSSRIVSMRRSVVHGVASGQMKTSTFPFVRSDWTKACVCFC